MSLSRKRILVGDADEIVLALILHILQRQGYEVDVTTRPEEFSDKLRARDYHAVLVDPNRTLGRRAGTGGADRPLRGP